MKKARTELESRNIFLNEMFRRSKGLITSRRFTAKEKALEIVHTFLVAIDGVNSEIEYIKMRMPDGSVLNSN